MNLKLRRKCQILKTDTVLKYSVECCTFHIHPWGLFYMFTWKEPVENNTHRACRVTRQIQFGPVCFQLFTAWQGLDAPRCWTKLLPKPVGSLAGSFKSQLFCLVCPVPDQTVSPAAPTLLLPLFTSLQVPPLFFVTTEPRPEPLPPPHQKDALRSRHTPTDWKLFRREPFKARLKWHHHLH